MLAASNPRKISSPAVYPALVIASNIISNASSLDDKLGANPPSSPTAELKFFEINNFFNSSNALIISFLSNFEINKVQKNHEKE